MPNLVFQLLDLRRKELHRGSAPGTNHVMVVASIVLVLVARNTVVKRDLAGESALGEQLESAVHGGESDLRILLLHQPVKFVGREVIASLQERAQDRIALASMFQPDSLEMVVENAFRLADHLVRDVGYIVDSFRKHWFEKKISRLSQELL